jgi:hypothetical protein
LFQLGEGDLGFPLRIAPGRETVGGSIPALGVELPRVDVLGKMMTLHPDDLRAHAHGAQKLPEAKLWVFHVTDYTTDSRDETEGG